MVVKFILFLYNRDMCGERQMKRITGIHKIRGFILAAAVLTAGIFFSISGCKKATLVATDGATLHVSVNPSQIPVGGTATVTVIGYKASGSTLPDGTVIFFSVNLGSIDPQAETRGGRAEVTFRSDDNRSGTAEITATSGNATMSPEQVTIEVGVSQVETLVMSANPQVLGPGGGTAQIYVTAYDENTNPLANVPITLTTTAGQLSSGGASLTTGADGRVQDTLQTTATAELTASSGSITANLTVTVETNESPVASFVFSPTTPLKDQTVHFDASGSTDNDGSIVSYQWNFGDGDSGSGRTASHRFRHAGTYDVLLTVTDDDGAANSTSNSVSVTLGAAPVASFVYSPRNPGINQDVYFDASGSTDSDGQIVSYEWNFGDGYTSTGRTVTHRFNSAGTYVVSLVVTDDRGNQHSTNDQVTIGTTDVAGKRR